MADFGGERMADYGRDRMEDFFLLLPLVQNDSFLESLRNFLIRGKDPNCHIACYNISLFPRVIRGYTLLQAAANSAESNLGAVTELINSGADVNLANSAGYTPLHFAVKRRKYYVFDLLLQSGGHLSINAKTYFGQTPLQFAIYNYENYHPPDIGIIRKMLDCEDININTTDEGLSSPLMLAVEFNCLEIVELLLSKGANPNVGKDFVGGTCLHTALSTFEPNYYIVRQLLINGADIYKLNSYMRTPMDILIENVTNHQGLRFAMRCLKVVALHYHVRNDLMVKLYAIPDLLQFVQKCCAEVTRMKGDNITDNFTLHHFLSYRFQDKYFINPRWQVYLPVVEKLTHGFYIEYFYDIFDHISNNDLRAITDIIVRSGRAVNGPDEVNYIQFFEKMNIFDFSKYLSRLDRFYLIVAFSNVRITEALQDLGRRGLGFSPM